MDLPTYAKKVRNAYHKQWRDANPDKWKEIQNRYWTKKARELEQTSKNRL